MKDNEKEIKRFKLTPEEVQEFDNARNQDGFKKNNEYLMYLVRNRGDYTDVMRRRVQQYQYRYSELYTIYNKLRSGIDVTNNIEKFMQEARKLCQELM